MKRIHFINLGRNKYWLIVILLSMFLMLVYIFQFIKFENPKIYKHLLLVAYLLMATYWSRLYWYKNTVQWNRKGVLIRINSFFGKSLNFNQIKEVELNEKKLIITKNNNKTITFDLTEFEKSDIQKLIEIITKNAYTKTMYK